MVGFRKSVFWCSTIGLGSGLEASGDEEGTAPIMIGRRTEGGIGGMADDACVAGIAEFAGVGAH